MKDEDEIWRVVPSVNGCEASSLGRIRYEGKIKPLSATGKYARFGRGYLAARIRGTLLKAHRLVAEAFISNPSSFPQINHLDGDTLNNRPGNLEWTDNSGNQKHATETGLHIALRGEEIGTSRYSESQVTEALRLRSELGFGFIRAARATGLSQHQTKRIFRGVSWKHVAR